MKKLKVIVWTTGKIGKRALFGIADDPRLELVGVYAHSKEKVGMDSGALCGLPNSGIRATDEVDALVALGADTIIYAPYEADLSHLVKLLEGGSDVISTNLLSNLEGLTGEVKKQIEAACARGGSSFYITGINPGWIDTLSVAVTTICRRIESISVTESVSVAHYESAKTWLAVGMSMSESTPAVVQSARERLTSFRDSVTSLADALHLELDDVEFNIEYGRTRNKIDLGWFCMEKGTYAALRAGWHGKIKGRTVIRNQVVWYMTKDLIEDWELDQNNYLVDIVGEPGLELRVRVTTPKHWSHLDHAYVTAMPAVSSALKVYAARPGILGLEGAGLPAAPVGVWPRQ